MVLLENRPASFAGVPTPQRYANMAGQASLGHHTNGYQSFGESNGQRPQKASQTSLIYTAVYSSVPVYEMEVHGVAVMRRRSDSWLNATQILKVSGVDKGKRTKILEKEILTGEYEKVQGGYGKYQGTWINYKRGREFCRQYGVEELLQPLLDYDMGADGSGNTGTVDTPTKEQAMAANRKRFYNGSLDGRLNGQGSGGTFFQNISPTASNALAAMHKAARFESPMPRPGSAQRRPANVVRRHSQQQSASQDSAFPDSQQSVSSFMSDHGMDGMAPPDSTYGTNSGNSYSRQSAPRQIEAQEPPRKKLRQSSNLDMYASYDNVLQEETPTEANDSFLFNHVARESEQGPLALQPLDLSEKSGEDKRLALLDLFADPSRTDFSTHTAILHLSGQDLDVPLDASANTALHWAATLARVSLMRLLVSRGANLYRGNAAGQTPLMAAIQVNNSFDHGCFPEMLEILGPLIDLRDATGRTVLHHIAVSSGIKGRNQSSRYYLESLLEFTVRKGGSNPNSQQSFIDTNNSGRARPMTLGRFMAEVVNVQDKSGNTALNLAARIGNRAIIDQLDEVGADYGIPNNTGFKPADFGVVPRGQTSLSQSADPGLSQSQTKTSSHIDQIKEEILATTSSILSQTQSQYSAELQHKQDLVDTQNAQLRDTAVMHKEASDRLESIKRRTKDRADRNQKIANLRHAIAEQSTKVESNLRYQQNLSLAMPDVDASMLPTIADLNDNESNGSTTYLSSLPSPHNLRARITAHTKCNAALETELVALQGRSSKLEGNYRRVVSLCTGVPEDQVDSMLEGLVAAVESEGLVGSTGDFKAPDLEVGRVREFLRKVEGVVG